MRETIEYNGRKCPIVCDTTLIGDWEEVSGVQASTITKRPTDTEKLDGLIIRGYEMKFAEGTNENGQRYDKGAFSGFIKKYFVDKELEMVCDINHEGFHNYKAICGKVLYCEVNTKGLYFAVYIPRKFEDFEGLKWRLEEGIIQGFSKEGFAVDWEYRYKPDGSFDYELIKEINLVSVSLVSMPANGLNFEKMQEVRNRLAFVDNTKKKTTLEELFNK